MKYGDAMMGRNEVQSFRVSASKNVSQVELFSIYEGTFFWGLVIKNERILFI